MNPGDRPRKTLATVLGVVAAAAAVTGLAVVVDTSPAAADELERFASCEAIAEWGAQDAPPEEEATSLADDTVGGSTGGMAADGDQGSAASAPQAAPTSGDAMGGDALGSEVARESSSDLARTGGDVVDDGTNVVVEGVDELDVIDRIDAEHVLVTAGSRLSIVSLVDDQIVANLPVGYSVEASYDADRGIAWVVGPDDEDGTLTVHRVRVTPTSLAEDASWETPGWLVDARRVGDRLHLVAADGYGAYPMGGGAADGPAVDGPAIPFASGPVPCDQVLHPVGDSDTTATLLVTLPAEGPLEPLHATEVVGSGEQVHVTTEAAYLATPLYRNDGLDTTIHRFDLEDLSLTGSGRVPGGLLNEFSMSEHDGFLRVAVTDQSAMRGRAFEGDMVVPDVATDAVPAPDVDVAPVPLPMGVPAESLNQVLVLDTDGALDVVGRTPKFGHPGESLQGIRFDGVLAYAVTYLQTDPFYVLELDDPTAPVVAGEVELPGFSSYLHPVAEDLVAGFGPDDEGHVAVKLFDVSDRTQPKVVDTISLGDESPVAWDHHALVDLGGGRFAVPASVYREQVPSDCTPQRRTELQAEDDGLNAQMNGIWGDTGEVDPADQPRLDALSARQQEIYEEGCLYPQSRPASSVVVLEVADGHLRVVGRIGDVLSDTSASRVVPTDDGWALLAGNHWFVVDGTTGAQTADLELGPDDGYGYPIAID